MAFSVTPIPRKILSGELIFRGKTKHYYIRAMVGSPILGRQITSAVICAENEETALIKFEAMTRGLGWSLVVRPAFASVTLAGLLANRNRVNGSLSSGELSGNEEMDLLMELEDCLDCIEAEELVATRMLAAELYISEWMGIGPH